MDFSVGGSRGSALNNADLLPHDLDLPTSVS